jgi:dephospho-CoA kinase
MKIAICGKMASGKTTLAQELKLQHNFEIVSMASEVKRVGKELFGMVEKDRPLLQQIGMKMREIRESVWLDCVIRESNKLQLVVCDDIRFINEAKTLKDNGWTLIKLDIQDDLQKIRLKDAYGDKWEGHWNNRNDPSETEVDKIPLEWFDLIISAVNGSAIHLLRPHIKSNE